jgi:hypothetical protein
VLHPASLPKIDDAVIAGGDISRYIFRHSRYAGTRLAVTPGPVWLLQYSYTVVVFCYQGRVFADKKRQSCAGALFATVDTRATALEQSPPAVYFAVIVTTLRRRVLARDVVIFIT